VLYNAIQKRGPLGLAEVGGKKYLVRMYPRVNRPGEYLGVVATGLGVATAITGIATGIGGLGLGLASFFGGRRRERESKPAMSEVITSLRAKVAGAKAAEDKAKMNKILMYGIPIAAAGVAAVTLG